MEDYTKDPLHMNESGFIDAVYLFVWGGSFYMGIPYWPLLAPIGPYWLLLAPIGPYWLLWSPINST